MALTLRTSAAWLARAVSDRTRALVSARGRLSLESSPVQWRKRCSSVWPDGSRCSLVKELGNDTEGEGKAQLCKFLRPDCFLRRVPMSEPIRLTQYSHGAGCGCKISPRLLETILAGSGAQNLDPRL